MFNMAGNVFKIILEVEYTFLFLAVQDSQLTLLLPIINSKVVNWFKQDCMEHSPSLVEYLVGDDCEIPELIPLIPFR